MYPTTSVTVVRTTPPASAGSICMRFNINGMLNPAAAAAMRLMAIAPAGVVAHAPPAHVDSVRDWLANNGHGGVSVEGNSNLWDGVAIQDPERTFRISNTLTGRFARVEQEARKRCMMALFSKKAAEDNG